LESSEALKRAVFFIQHEIGRKMRLKYTPKIKFIYDDSLEKGARIENALREIHLSESSLPKRRGKKDES
jgi:ribosome-binding factor A